MADANVSQLEINGTTYDICDATARDSLSQNYLPLTAGEDKPLIGHLGIKSNDIDRDSENPSAQQWGKGIMFLDKDNENLGSINIVRETDGRTRMSLYVDNEDENENHLNNAFSMYVAKDGTKTYWLSSPTNFREAIGNGNANAFMRADGTLSRVLEGNIAWITKYTNFNIKSSTNGLSSDIWPGALQLVDTNGLIANYYGGTIGVDGAVGAGIHAYNYNSSGTQVGHSSFTIYVKKDGTTQYGVTAPDAFRKAIGITKTTGSCTPTSVMTGGSIALYKYGQIVVAIANNIITSTINNRTQIATISNSAYYPSHQAYGVLNGLADGYYLIIDSQGKIYVDKTVSGKWGWAVWTTN